MTTKTTQLTPRGFSEETEWMLSVPQQPHLNRLRQLKQDLKGVRRRQNKSAIIRMRQRDAWRNNKDR